MSNDLSVSSVQDEACVFQKKVPGSSTVNLGQITHDWRPLIHTTVNLSEIRRYVCDGANQCTVKPAQQLICGQEGAHDSSGISN